MTQELTEIDWIDVVRDCPMEKRYLLRKFSPEYAGAAMLFKPVNYSTQKSLLERAETEKIGGDSENADGKN